MFHRNICCSARKKAAKNGVKRVDPTFFIYNDGRHLFVADQISLSGRADWKWIRYQDFPEKPKDLDEFIITKKVTLRHHGHIACWAKVTVRHLLEHVYGKHNKIQIVRDWQMSFTIPPRIIILICTVGEKSAFALM